MSALVAMVNDQTEERLQRMLATGLWGDTLSAVADALVMDGVRRACEAGLITVNPPVPPLSFTPGGTVTVELTGGGGGGGPAPPSAAPEILAEFAAPPTFTAPVPPAEDPDYADPDPRPAPSPRTHAWDYANDRPLTAVISETPTAVDSDTSTAVLPSVITEERDGPAYDPGMEEPAPVRGACAFCGIVHLGACDEMPF